MRYYAAMLIDANSLPHGHHLETDICIIGAGAAGITLAAELAASWRNITLLESGGFDFSAETQQLYAGEYIARDTFTPTTSRLRYFGGTTNHWAGNCMQFTASDLAHRAWMPYSGWPLDYTELQPYYARAGEYCELQSADFDPGYWAKQGLFTLLETDNNLFRQELVMQSRPTRFGVRYREQLLSADNINITLHANVCSLVPVDKGSHISHLECRTLAGNRFRVSARQYILACGGIENARLLLASNRFNTTPISTYPENIGACFLDNAVAHGGTLVCDKGTKGLEMFRGQKVLQGQHIRGVLRTSPALQQASRIGDCFLVIGPGRGLSSYTKAYLRNAKDDVLHLDIAALLKHQLRLVKHVGKHFADPPPDSNNYDLYTITVHLEQRPNPDCRISLGNTSDALGMPRVKVEWQLTEFDFNTMQRTLEIFANEMGRLGIGRFHFELGEGPIYPERMSSGPHHAGTTRMSDDPRDGVVDRNCKVHGVDNLYIAGGSVFPTSSSAMPTLTIVALAVRLAEHLAGLES